VGGCGNAVEITANNSRAGRYSKGGSLDSRYGRSGGGPVGVGMYPGGGGGTYLPDLAAASGHGHYLSELAAPPGGHYMTGVGGGGEPFGGGQPGAPNATWQDLIQPRLSHIIKGKVARDCIIVFRHIPYFATFQVGFEKLSCIIQILFKFNFMYMYY
jgi:hypothetical protein